MGIIYTARTLGGTSLPEVNFPLPSGTLGLLLTNNSVWDLTVFSPLWNLTVPSYSVATMPASGNLQITVKGLSKDTTLIALSNASVSWGSSNVSVPLNISPIASKAVVPVQISGTVTAEIDTSGGPVEVSGNVSATFPAAQDVNLAANNAGNLTIDIANASMGNVPSDIQAGVTFAEATGATEPNGSYPLPAAVEQELAGFWKMAAGTAGNTEFSAVPVASNDPSNPSATNSTALPMALHFGDPFGPLQVNAGNPLPVKLHTENPRKAGQYNAVIDAGAKVTILTGVTTLWRYSAIAMASGETIQILNNGGGAVGFFGGSFATVSWENSGLSIGGDLTLYNYSSTTGNVSFNFEYS